MAAQSSIDKAAAINAEAGATSATSLISIAMTLCGRPVMDLMQHTLEVSKLSKKVRKELAARLENHIKTAPFTSHMTVENADSPYRIHLWLEVRDHAGYDVNAALRAAVAKAGLTDAETRKLLEQAGQLLYMTINYYTVVSERLPALFAELRAKCTVRDAHDNLDGDAWQSLFMQADRREYYIDWRAPKRIVLRFDAVSKTADDAADEKLDDDAAGSSSSST